MKVHIGLDDTDSPAGGCTTYLAARFIRHLKNKAQFLDYPNLIRLNPNIPWKTRGNGAVCLRFETDRPNEDFQALINILRNTLQGEQGSCHPGVVMLCTDRVPEEVEALSMKALSSVVSVKRALELIREFRMSYYAAGRGMGLVGAVAAIGNTLRDDHTYEIVAYRERAYWGKKRLVDPRSVVEMSKKTYPRTYNSFDPETGRVLITPRGPDPVLLGIRGEDPDTLMQTLPLLSIGEPMESYVIFRTNQGTGEHLASVLNLGALKAYSSGFVVGRVSAEPCVARGGHVFFKIKDESGEARCAVYEPTGPLRRVAIEMRRGDLIRVGGGVRSRSRKNPIVINVEYISIINLAEHFHYRNPLCAKCGGRMSSMGLDQGYRCKKCGFRDPHAQKVAVKVSRLIEQGIYVPPPRAHRHLTKPLQRYGLEKRWDEKRPMAGWFSFVDEAEVCKTCAS